ncbi:hypothetical protein A3C60_02345 [Candidatus Nomurabacteria bacterium RIFCSPHIGHO2_02_FULL_37_45]|nr:MAG: hypothetical protein A2727_00220 [Candidatus Nomurabacteria bacterium RIFCSPHIGHO2_01_FULL_37_110]OGI71010.1 MAG: hypothetical protein A3C60_02345 [Candidatus Nomurabacteria bacterium RIFCSPHIGHO2_02_FULL_37_45]
MIRFILPLALIGITISVFFVFTDPMYKDIAQLRTQLASYNEALNNSKMLENERDKLTAKFNAINPENLMKLEKLLPENIDNIRLILEIEQVALPYGMVLKNIKYNTIKDIAQDASGDVATPQGGGVGEAMNKDYGIWDLEFSTTGTYSNFINFTKDLEKNLRIVDISSIEFSSNINSGPNSSLPEVYQYNFKIKTYWLKN